MREALRGSEMQADGKLDPGVSADTQALMLELFVHEARRQKETGADYHQFKNARVPENNWAKAETLAQAAFDYLFGRYGFAVNDTWYGLGKDACGWRISPTFSGWLSRAFIRLYELSLDSKWLDRAQISIDGINARFREPSGAYSTWACWNGHRLVVDAPSDDDKKKCNASTDRHTCLDQATMSQAMALLSMYREAPQWWHFKF